MTQGRKVAPLFTYAFAYAYGDAHAYKHDNLAITGDALVQWRAFLNGRGKPPPVSGVPVTTPARERGAEGIVVAIRTTADKWA